jgi:serine/threonine protein kinase
MVLNLSLLWNIVLEVFSNQITKVHHISSFDCNQNLSLSNFTCLGSLDKLLYDSNMKLNEDHKIRLVRGIAAGMLHLHKNNIVHRDLAARNILLTSEGDPKISVLSLFVFLFSFY